MLRIAYLTSSGNDIWVFLSVRLLLILCISSKVSCSLHYNEIVYFRCHIDVSKKTPVHFR